MMKRRFVFHALLLGMMMILVVTCSHQPETAHQRSPHAVQGSLDLTNWDFNTDGPVNLSGDFAFYWQQYIDPAQFAAAAPPSPHTYVEVPGSWTHGVIQGRDLPAQGYATYHLTILLRRGHAPLVFEFPTLGAAYRIYANGDLIQAAGIPGATPAQTRPGRISSMIEPAPEADRIDLVIWMSNFDYYKGGIENIGQLGRRPHIHQQTQNRLIMSVFMMSCILIMGLYHLSLFGVRRQDKSSLYFGIFCLLIVLKASMHFETLYGRGFFTFLSWETMIRLDIIAYYLATPIFGMFLFTIYQAALDQLTTIVLRVIQFLSALASLIVLLTPPMVFFHTLPYVHALILLGSLYALSQLFILARRGYEGARLHLIGFACFAMIFAFDIFKLTGIFHATFFTPFGLLGFIFFQAVLIASRFANAFRTVELQRQALAEANLNYERELAQRKQSERERQALEERLARAQKMEVLGQLAGGVAHDLNNVLSCVVSYPELLLLDEGPDSPLRTPLLAIKKSGLKMAAMVQDLLTMARRNVSQFEVVNLNEVIDDYLTSAENAELRRRHPQVKLFSNLDHQLLNIEASKIHVRKSIMNLVVNGMEAQPEGGKVVISTQNRHVDQPLAGYDDVQPGDYVVCTIADAGAGIPAEDVQHVFEPFYTRKSMGQSGTGLGLAVVWGTMQDHQGYIDLKSTAGQGTTFELYFKATRNALTPPPHSVPIEHYRGNGEHILVVDDMAEQRELASALLTQLRYTVDAVSSGEEALSYIQHHAVDLLLLDMIMGSGMDGLETYRCIRDRRPEIKSVIASGYAETHRVQQARAIGAGTYIQKPYTLEKLGLAIRTQLDRHVATK